MPIRPRHVALSCTQRILSRHYTLGAIAHITVIRDDHLRIVAHLSVLDHCVEVLRACLGQVDFIRQVAVEFDWLG